MATSAAAFETPRSREFMMKKDPRDPWGAADNFDVNDDAFIATKKTLMRLARLCAGDVRRQSLDAGEDRPLESRSWFATCTR